MVRIRRISGKERLHSPVEDLPEPAVHAAPQLVEYLRREASDPVARAPQEAGSADEPVTDGDPVELEATERDRQEGRMVPHEGHEAS